MSLGSRVYTQPRAVRSKLFSLIANIRSFFFGDACRYVEILGRRIDLREVESVLKRHDSVQECAVVSFENGVSGRGLAAYVVPEDHVHCTETSHSDTVENRSKAAGAACGHGWKMHNPEPEKAEYESSDFRNTVPEHERSGAAKRSIERVLALNPKRVLEIGFGPGAPVSRRAFHRKEHVGTGNSSAALQYSQWIFESDVKMEARKCLCAQKTDGLTEIAPGSFDAVIINSVAQYFPNIQYLVDVLEKAVNSTQEGGIVFIGDLHGLPQLEEPCISGFPICGDSAPCAENREFRMQESILKQQELAVDPAFFDAFARRTLGITNVEILLKRDHYTHMAPCAHYDVILHVGGESHEEVAVTWQRWECGTHSVTLLHELCTDGDIFAFQGVPNKRFRVDGVDPEMFWKFGDDVGFAVDITWPDLETAGSYDVVLRRGAMAYARAVRVAADPMPWDAYANRPVRFGTRNTLASEWCKYLKQELPELVMAHTMFFVVESLPRTAKGEVDRCALRLRESERQVPDSTTWIIPAILGEETLCGTAKRERVAV